MRQDVPEAAPPWLPVITPLRGHVRSLSVSTELMDDCSSRVREISLSCCDEIIRFTPLFFFLRKKHPIKNQYIVKSLRLIYPLYAFNLSHSV